MKTNFSSALVCATALALIAPLALTHAQDIEYASHGELNNIYNRLEEIEAQIAAANTTGGQTALSDHDWRYACDCCDRSGFIAGAELGWLKGYDSDGNLDLNWEPSFRGWLGWQRADGLGVRARYFYYFQDPDANADRLHYQTVDLEVFDAVNLGRNWDLNIAGGFRYAELFHQNNSEFHEINGPGPVVSAELVRHVGCGFALYALGRQSIIVGNGFDDSTRDVDLTTATTDIQLGVQLHREWNGAMLFGRIGWDIIAINDLQDNDELVTLMGGVFNIGIMR